MCLYFIVFLQIALARQGKKIDCGPDPNSLRFFTIATVFHLLPNLQSLQSIKSKNTVETMVQVTCANEKCSQKDNVWYS